MEIYNLSDASSKTYKIIDAMLNSTALERQATCLLSLADVNDIKEYHKWISVQLGKGHINMYSVTEFAEYCSNYKNATIIPDPSRCMPNLKYMLTRLNRLQSMNPYVAGIPISVITQELKTTVLKKFFNLDDTQHSLPIDLTTDNVHQLAINCGLSTFDSIGLLHKNVTTVKEAEELLKNHSYMLRLSTRGNKKNTNDCTVFTVTMRIENGFYHIRFMDVHGVGVYVITSFPKNEVAVSDLNYNTIMYNCDMHEVLKKINYEKPTYACITDLLLHLHQLKYIDLYSIYRAYLIPS